jgi:hypothetical protein
MQTWPLQPLNVHQVASLNASLSLQLYVPMCPPQVLGTSAMNGGGPDAIVLWQLIGAGVSMVVAPMAYSLKVCVGGAAQWLLRCKSHDGVSAAAAACHAEAWSHLPSINCSAN